MITSLQNDYVKSIVALRDSRERRKSGLTLIDGVRDIERALKSGIAIKQCIYTATVLNEQQGKNILAKFNALRVECVEVSDKVFEKIAFGDWVEGIIAIAVAPSLELAQLRLTANPIVVVLESLEKPGNLGAILRSCDGAGVEAVLVCDAKTDIYNPNVIRASTGIVFSLPVIADSADNIKAYLAKHKIMTVAATPDAKESYTKVDYRKPTAFICGAEDKGLSLFWLNAANKQIRIPMNGLADSLNVSVSAALLVYEALRQRAEA